MTIVRWVIAAALISQLTACGGGSPSAPLGSSPESTVHGPQVTTADANGLAAHDPAPQRADNARPAITYGSGPVYYVDELLGSDLSTNPQSPATPYQSLAKLQSVGIAGGSTVLLACGRIWRESLTLPSGTSSNPTTVDEYAPTGVTCTTSNKPTIDGSYSIPPANNWTNASGSIYSADLSSIEEVLNGDFTPDQTGWKKTGGIWNTSTCTVSGTTTYNCLQVWGGTSTFFVRSTPFALEKAPPGSSNYSISYWIQVQSGASVVVSVGRVSSGPYSYTQTIVGDGLWHQISGSFGGGALLSGAQIQLQIPASTPVRLADVHVKATFANQPILAIQKADSTFNPDTDFVVRAHWPGSSAGNPYGIITSQTSTSITIDTGDVQANDTIYVKSQPYVLDQRTISSAVPGGGSSVVTLSANLTASCAGSNPCATNYGYYLTGDVTLAEPYRFMSGPSWQPDIFASPTKLFVWMSDGNAPGVALVATRLATGIDLSSTSYVQVNNIHIKNTAVGVNLAAAQNSLVQNSIVENTASTGIQGYSSTSPTIINNVIQYTGGDAIDLQGQANPGGSKLADIEYNIILDSAVTFSSSGAIQSLPTPTNAAIAAGPQSTILHNSVVNSGRMGIFAFQNGTNTAGTNLIQQNYVKGACSVLSDCGGIYIAHGEHIAGTSATIAGNYVDSPNFNLNGQPSGASRLSQGIYLDEYANEMIVSGNTIVGATYGIEMHKATSNSIFGNVIFDSQFSGLYLLDDVAITLPPASANNSIYGNSIAATDGTPTEKVLGTNAGAFSVYETSANSIDFSGFGYMASFGSGGVGNVIDNRLFPSTIALRVSNSSFAIAGTNPRRTMLLAEWGGDPSAWGETQDANSPLVSGTSSPLSLGTLYGSTCEGPTLSITCYYFDLHDLLSTGKTTGAFTISSGTLYRVAFDAALAEGASTTEYNVAVNITDTGAVSKTSNVFDSTIITVSPKWQRYSMMFRANSSFSGAVVRIGEYSATPGYPSAGTVTVYISGIKVAPMVIADPAPANDGLVLLSNKNLSGGSISVPCPSAYTSAECGNAYVLGSSSTVVWPISIAPLTSYIVNIRSPANADSDGDSVPNSQDTVCTSTPAGKYVSLAGCQLATGLPVP